MRDFAILLSVLASVASAAEIPEGAHVLLRMENSISTRTAKEGDFVYLRTAVPIASSGDIADPPEATCRAWFRCPSRVDE
jgi:hypothetical protein